MKNTCLRDFESIIFDEKHGVKKLTSLLEIKFNCPDGEYLVYIVKWDDRYHVFHGWSWFDGDKYGFHYGGIL